MDTYLLYLRTYAMVASGTRLTAADFLDEEARDLDPVAQAAVTLAAHDFACVCMPRTRNELNKEICGRFTDCPVT